MGAQITDRVKSILSLRASYLLACVLNSCSSSLAKGEEVSLAGEREVEPSVTGPAWLRDAERDGLKIPIGSSSVSRQLQIRANWGERDILSSGQAGSQVSSGMFQ